jgi:hypothetical protein
MKLEISEGCFGQNVSVDGESLFKHEYDERPDSEVEKLQQILLDEISKIKSSLDMHDWSQIAEILTYRSQEFLFDEKNSTDYESCDQCGNTNWRHIYTKTDVVNEVKDIK